MTSVNAHYVEERYAGPMEQAGFISRRLKRIRQLLPVDGTLLEIGALDGSTVKYYKERFKGSTCGIDISLEVLKGADTIIDEVKPCDLSKDSIPWPDATFDVVVCAEVIEHIYDTDRLLKEINRVLKPQGCAIISTPNLASLVNRLFLLFGYQPMATEVSAHVSNYGNRFRSPQRPAGHIRNFTYRAFIEILKANGFSIDTVDSVHLSEKKGAALLDSFGGRISPSLGSDVIVKCRKQ